MHFQAIVDGTAGQLDDDLSHILVWSSLELLQGEIVAVLQPSPCQWKVAAALHGVLWNVIAEICFSW